MKKKILVVEDDPQYRDLLINKLSGVGYEMLSAGDGQEAMNIVKTTKPDLIVLDLVMPKMDGVNFYYELTNTLGKSVPTIILTNLSEAAYPSDIKDFMVKANTSLDDVLKKVKEKLSA